MNTYEEPFSKFDFGPSIALLFKRVCHLDIVTFGRCYFVDVFGVWLIWFIDHPNHRRWPDQTMISIDFMDPTSNVPCSSFPFLDQRTRFTACREAQQPEHVLECMFSAQTADCRHVALVPSNTSSCTGRSMSWPVVLLGWTQWNGHSPQWFGRSGHMCSFSVPQMSGKPCFVNLTLFVFGCCLWWFRQLVLLDSRNS